MDLTAPGPLAFYMVGTTVARVAIYIVGIWFVMRLTTLQALSKYVSFLVISIVLAGWTFLIINLARNNVFEVNENASFPPPMAPAIFIPLLVAYGAFRYWKPWRETVFRMSQTWLIGIQSLRVMGGIILMLYWRDMLPWEFALVGGGGDFITGIMAIPIAYAYFKGKPGSHSWIRAWNTFGIIEMIGAVTLGLLTSPSPVQLLSLDAPNVMTTIYPLVLFPLFSIPVGIILHIYSFALLQKEAGQPETTTIPWRLMLFFAAAIFTYTSVFYILAPLTTDRPIGFQADASVQRSISAHPVGLYLHIIPAMIALILGPFQFWTDLRNKRPNWHRWLGKIYLGSILLGGIGGLYLAPFSTGGLSSVLGFALLAMVWLYTGSMALIKIRAGDIDQHRAWMIRNYALTFAAVTLRLYTRIFFALDWELPDFHPINAWLCWLPNLIVAEWIITRSRVQASEMRKTRVETVKP